MLKFVCIFILLLLPAQTVHAYEGDNYIQYLSRQQEGGVRIYPLDEITEGHPLYDILNRTIEQQFGVYGGISNLVENFNERIAEYQAQQIENRRRERQRNINRVIIALAVALAMAGVNRLMKRKRDAESDDNDYDSDIDDDIYNDEDFRDVETDRNAVAGFSQESGANKEYKYDFKHSRVSLFLLVYFIGATLTGLLVVILESMIILVLLCLWIAPGFIFILRFTETDGHGILHEKHVEICLKNKVHEIEYRRIKDIRHIFFNWHINLKDGSTITINAPARFTNSDCMSIFMDALERSVRRKKPVRKI